MQTNVSDCPENLASWYCLNGARCFSVKIQESLLFNCWCRDGFHGARCDYKYSLHRQQERPQNEQQDAERALLGFNDSNQSLQIAGGDKQNDSSRMAALGMGFIEAPDRHEANFLGTSWQASRLRLNQHHHRHTMAAAATGPIYLIVLYYLSLFLALITLLWLILRFLPKNNKEPGQQQQCELPFHAPRVEVSATKGASQPRASHQSAARQINRYEPSKPVGGFKINLDQRHQDYARGINYNHPPRAGTNYGHANYCFNNAERQL